MKCIFSLQQLSEGLAFVGECKGAAGRGVDNLVQRQSQSIGDGGVEIGNLYALVYNFATLGVSFSVRCACKKLNSHMI